MKRYWIRYSPRGFSNEIYYAYGTRPQVEEALRVINDDPSAWAEAVPYASVRSALAQARREGLELEWAGIFEITEDLLRRHRPMRIG